MEAPSTERNEGVPMDKKPLPTVASLPLPVYLLALTLTLLCMVLDCVPPNLVGAFLLLMVLGEGLSKLGNTIPVVKTYLGGSVVCFSAERFWDTAV